MEMFFKSFLGILLIASTLGINTEIAMGTEQENLIKPFEEACFGKNIPPKVPLAIAKHESGLNPYAVNVAGTGYMPDSKEEALEIMRAAEATGASYDVGLMQINNQWFSRLRVTPESLLEPDKNIEIGVKILAGEFAKHGKNWTAVGYYHSPSKSRGIAYSKSIYQLYHGFIQPRTSKSEENHSEIKIAKIKNKQGKAVQNYAEQKTGNQNLLNKQGIWRNPSTSGKNRVVAFQVRKPGIIRLSSSKPGKSSSQTGTSED